MASIISAGTTSGTALNMTGDTSGVLQLATNGSTTAITIDTSQKVGIGTTSPSDPLTVNNDGVVTGAGWTEIARISNTAQSKGFNFGYNASANNATLVSQSGGAASGIEFWGYTGSAWAERMRIDSNGNLLVGGTSNVGPGSGRIAITSPDMLSTVAGLGVKNNANNTGGSFAFWVNSSNSIIGTISQNSSTTVGYNTSSDYRLKENIAPMTGALAKISALKPVTYTWKTDGSDGQGFIAHELAEVIPDAVSGEKDAVNEDGSIKAQGVDTSFLVATLTAAIQEQQTIINDLKARITALEGAA